MSADQFRQLAAEGYNLIPVVREVLADFETPLSTYSKLADGVHTYLFESVQGGEKWGRYSIIGLPCSTVLRVVGHTITVEKQGEVIERHELDDPFVFVESFK
ncbi:MAG: anthranilate synthase component I, partial [Pseudohongiella sp.]